MRDSVADLIEKVCQSAPEFIKLFSPDDQEFEDAFDSILEKAIFRLEKYKSKFASLDEEALSGFLASAIELPGLTVTTEAFSGGHVDITIELNFSSPKRIKLAEAKIYHGPAYHLNGLSQLINRYSTGREGRGMVIVYVRQDDIKALMKKIADELDATLPCMQQGSSRPHNILRWSLLTSHKHSSGELMEVGHIGCNLFVS